MISIKRPTILFVSMPGAIHTGRWIDQLVATGWELHLFSPYATSDLTIHPTVPESVTLHLVVKQRRSRVLQRGLHFPIERGDRVRSLVTNVYERFRSRAERLARLIEKIKPDVVHSMEITGAGYLTLEAKKIVERRGGKFPKWIYSIWGNDLFMYGPMPEHGPKIRQVLGELDYIFTDCERDNELTIEYGFRGELLGVFPTGGGFPVAEMQKFAHEKTAERKLIALKGIIRDDNQGRALVALDALAKCADALSGHEVVIYSPDSRVVAKVEEMNGRLPIKLLPALSHEEFIKLMGRTKISIGMNVSDGTPNTMLESMMMGAFPVQSDTVSTREWIDDGVNGLLVDPDDVDGLARALTDAINDPQLLEAAAAANMRLIKDTLEREDVGRQIVRIYERIIAGEVEE